MMNDIETMIEELEWAPWIVDRTGTTFERPTFSEPEIRRFEDELGYTLPRDYRYAVSECGGSRPEPTIVLADLGDRQFSEIFGTLFFVELDPNSIWFRHYDNLLHGLRDIRTGSLAEWMEFTPRKDTMLPFAGDGGVGYYCFDFGLDPISPPVLFLDYSGRTPEDDGWDNSLYVIADSFTELLGMLGDP
jgi:hypothetical protein